MDPNYKKAYNEIIGSLEAQTKIFCPKDLYDQEIRPILEHASNELKRLDENFKHKSAINPKMCRVCKAESSCEERDDLVCNNRKR